MIGKVGSDLTLGAARDAARLTALSIVLDDVGYVSSAATADPRGSPPTIDQLGGAGRGLRQLPHHRAVLADPGLPADRAQPSPGRDGPCRRPRGPADLATRGGSVTSTGSSLRSCAMPGTPRLLSESGITPEDETHMAAPRDTWPVGRGCRSLVRVPCRGDPPVRAQPVPGQPAGCRPVTRRGLSPQRGPRRSGGRSISATSAPSTTSSRSSSTSPPGACHSPHHAPREWIERYARRMFDDGGDWDAWRDATFARQMARARPRDHRARRGRPGCRPGDDLAPEEREVAARFMECFAGVPVAHRRRRSAGCSHFHRTSAATTTTRSSCSSPTTAQSSEGGTTGSINDARPWNGEPAGRRSSARIDEIGGPTPTTTTRGAGPSPATRRSGAGSARSTRGGCATRDRLGGRGHRGSPARSAPSTCTRSTCCRPCSTLIGVPHPADRWRHPEPDRRGEHPAPFESADAPDARTTQYFEMLGSRGALPRGVEGGDVQAARCRCRRRIDDAPFDDDVWELYHVAEDPSECHDLAAAEPERLAAMVDLWWEEARKYQVLPLDNRPIAALLRPASRSPSATATSSVRMGHRFPRT